MFRFIFILLILSLALFAKERIVALSPAINEILFALGAGEEVVGNTTYATYPKEAQNIPKVGGYFSVSLEKILALRPTLVLMQKNNLALKPKLEHLGIETHYISIASIKDIEQAIQKIGTLVHKKREAKELVAKIQKALDSLDGIVQNKKILVVFGRYERLDKAIYVSGNYLYFADIIKASGNQNAFGDKTLKQPTLSYEGIVALNPDIVYILAHQAREDQKELERLKCPWFKLPIRAAKYGTIYISTKKYAGMPSDRVVLFISDFKRVLEDARGRFNKLSTP